MGHFLGYGLLVGYLRVAHVGGNLEIFHNPGYKNVEMELAHSRYDELTCLLAFLCNKSGVFLGKNLQHTFKLVPVRHGLGLDGNRYYRLRELDVLKEYLEGFIAYSVAGLGQLEADDSPDVACREGVYSLLLVGVHPEEPCDTLPLVLAYVQHSSAV